jgi:hypothetical protein
MTRIHANPDPQYWAPQCLHAVGLFLRYFIQENMEDLFALEDLAVSAFYHVEDFLLKSYWLIVKKWYFFMLKLPINFVNPSIHIPKLQICKKIQNVISCDENASCCGADWTIFEHTYLSKMASFV